MCDRNVIILVVGKQWLSKQDHEMKGGLTIFHKH
jgi:hypothetical protein